MAYLVRFDSIRWDSPIRGIRQKVHRDGNRVLRLVEYSADMTPHWCSKGHVGHVVDGKIEITFRDRIDVFGPGDGVFIPSGPEHEHRGVPLTPTVTLWFVEEA
jgi:mannose-6-phosphate isomerase-like protein (cupin superfamily)